MIKDEIFNWFNNGLFKICLNESYINKIKHKKIPPNIDVERTTFSKYEIVSFPGVTFTTATDAFLNCSDIFSGS